MAKKYISIRAAAEEGPLSEYALRRMLADNRLPGIYIGTKFLINYPQLQQMLERDSIANVKYNMADSALKGEGGDV